MTGMNYQKDLMNNFSWVHQNCCKKKKHSEFECFFPEKKHSQARVFFLGNTTQTRRLFFETKLIVQIFKSYMQIKRACEKEKHPNTSTSFFVCMKSSACVFSNNFGVQNFHQSSLLASVFP